MFNNTTYVICPNSSNYDYSLHITNIIWHVCGLFGAIVGIPGNTFQIILLAKRSNRKEPSSLYFIAIAICELIFLVGSFWLWCANMSIIKIDPRQVFSCGIFYSIIVGSTTLSNLYLATMSIDRIVMIVRPTQYRLYVTQSRIIFRLIIIFLIIVLLLIPHHFYFYYDPQTTLLICDFHSFVSRQQIRLWSLIHVILFVSVPSLIFCVSTFLLVRNRCQHKRIQKNNISKSARRMHNRSIFIFLISIFVFLSLLPSCILEICIVRERFFSHDRSCSIRWKVYKILLNIFFTFASISYSVKFYIHLIMSTPFRKSFIQFITCRKIQDNISQSIRMDNGSLREQRLLQTNEQSKAKSEEVQKEI